MNKILNYSFIDTNLVILSVLYIVLTSHYQQVLLNIISVKGSCLDPARRLLQHLPQTLDTHFLIWMQDSLKWITIRKGVGMRDRASNTWYSCPSTCAMSSPTFASLMIREPTAAKKFPEKLRPLSRRRKRVNFNMVSDVRHYQRPSWILCSTRHTLAWR